MIIFLNGSSINNNNRDVNSLGSEEEKMGSIKNKDVIIKQIQIPRYNSQILQKLKIFSKKGYFKSYICQNKFYYITGFRG